MLYPYEQGATVYVTQEEYESLKAADATKSLIAKEEAMSFNGTTVAGPALDGNAEIYKYIPATISPNGGYTLDAKKAQALLQGSILAQANSNGYALPSLQYWAAIDDYALKAAVTEAAYDGNVISAAYLGIDSYKAVPSTFISSLKIAAEDKSEDESARKEANAALASSISAETSTWYINPYVEADTDGEGAAAVDIDHSLLRRYGYLKFVGYPEDASSTDVSLYGNIDSWTKVLFASSEAGLGLDGCPTSDFVKLYKNSATAKVNSTRTCIATRTGTYGHYGAASDWKVDISQKNWGYAWGKGFLEGLLVYPIAWMVDTFAFGMDPTLAGWSQLLALVFVTLIVRVLLTLATFRSTLNQQKMQALQPELAKIQAKYPNANTNQAEQARLSQEQMALYKRNKINPLSQILVLIIQFPVFICVWSGLEGSAALSSGEILNLRLSDTIRQTLFNVSGTWYLNTHGWWTALVLFILMAGTQVVSMLLPRWLTKKQTKKLSKMSTNPAETDAQKQSKWMMIIMLIFTIFMGFMLPSAMGVYWLISGLISMVTTIITQSIMAKKANKKKGKAQ